MASSAIRIDTDDFINPGAECVIEDKSKKAETGEKVQISLDDCLACSGCITSAEEIMLQQHNTSEVEKAIKSDKMVVATISPQSIAALAVDGDIDFVSKLKNLGVTHIYDTSLADRLALELSYQEFRDSSNKKPILCSACPGWVVYAEKTHGELIVPYLSKVKSAQQIMGQIIKSKNPEAYHFTVMPCFDKKLEAARKNNSVGEIREVDCVVSTAELKEMLSKEDCPMESVEIEKTDQSSERYDGPVDYLGSGGYLEFIYRKLKNGSKEEIKFTPYRRNNDFMETELEHEGRKIKMAKVYGFRSIGKIVSLVIFFQTICRVSK